MLIKGEVVKDGSHYIADIPWLGLSTEALNLKKLEVNIVDALCLLINSDDFGCEIDSCSSSEFYLRISDVNMFLPFALSQLRASKGMSIRDVAAMADDKSHTAYSRIESGERCPSLATFIKYLSAIDDQGELVFDYKKTS
jgi:hypothetical protein